MIYLKALLVGVLTAIVAEVVWVFVTLVLPGWVAMGLSEASGSGGLYATSTSVGPAALIGLLLGFGASLRRSLKRRRDPAQRTAT